MPTNDIVAAVDVGTSKICALVGRREESGGLALIGCGLAPSHGMKKGLVTDIERSAEGIADAVEKAQKMSGVAIKEVTIGIAGSHISSRNSRGVIAVSRESGEITASDVERALSASRELELPAEEKILHVLPRDFIVDGCEGISDPVGMSGVQLEVETHIVTGALSSIENLIKSVERADLEVLDIALEPLASSRAVLSTEERELGVALIDIGGGTTDIALFNAGSIVGSSVLPLGGDHITSDLAVGLRTPFVEAEKLKKEHGTALLSLVEGEQTVEFSDPSGESYMEVPLERIAEIVQPRMEEILGLIARELEEANSGGVIPGGLVFTGGSSLLRGIVELTQERLELPVRIGRPTGVAGLSESVRNPVFATGVGLLLYGMENNQRQRLQSDAHGFLEQVVKRVRFWMEELFGL